MQVLRIINEPTAASLAYGLDKKLPKNEVLNRTFVDVRSIFNSKENINRDYKENLKDDEQEEEEDDEKYIVVFDLGGGTFDVTLLNICKNNDDLNFEVITTNGEPLWGGSDFDQKLIDYCIKRFCEYNV